jgi:hypothetical protein
MPALFQNFKDDHFCALLICSPPHEAGHFLNGYKQIAGYFNLRVIS